MRFEDFEVGKKYQLGIGVVMTCVGKTTSGTPIMESPSGALDRVTGWGQTDATMALWREYSEPEEFYVVSTGGPSNWAFKDHKDATKYQSSWGGRVLHLREVR